MESVHEKKDFEEQLVSLAVIRDSVASRTEGLVGNLAVLKKEAFKRDEQLVDLSTTKMSLEIRVAELERARSAAEISQIYCRMLLPP